MHTYLWTAKDQWGNAVVRRITAPTVKQARALLLESKCTDLRLHTDEMIEISAQQYPELEKLPAEQRFKMLQQEPLTITSLLKLSLKTAKVTVIVGVVLGTWGFWARDWFSITLAVACLLSPPAITLWAARAGLEYTKVNFAKAWCRWDEILRRVERLKRMKTFRKLGFPEPELARLRAQALAGLGRFDDAMRDFQAVHESLNTPEWLYLSELSGLYEFARRYDDALATLRRAIEVGPENSNLWINYAFALVHCKGNAAEARAALQKAEAIEIIELALPKVALTYGLIARQEGDLSAAKGYLERALQGMLASPHRDLAEARIQIAKAYLASVYSALGDAVSARKLFGEAEAFLKATGEAQLLAECERALENPRLAA